MTSFEGRLSAYAPYFLALLRVITALLFMSHGTMKILGFPASDFQPPILSIFGIAGILEIVGGILLVLGFLTRPVAFILSGMMAVAYFMAHAGQAFVPAQNGGEPAVLFCFIFLYLGPAGCRRALFHVRRARPGQAVWLPPPARCAAAWASMRRCR
ncbi:MAG: DoxX family protein [Rhizobiales bacterium]|nr:DoxX family protein [Hyphomicrobiales bacterium]